MKPSKIIGINTYRVLREWLSEQEHIQWEYWSRTLAEELHTIQALIKKREIAKASHMILDRLFRWEHNWKPYAELDEDTKDFDRKWADQIIDSVPVKCPIYQCGGLMTTKERPFPKGENDEDYPDGRHGDEQSPDLICVNCGAIYEFKGFKK